MKDKKNLIERIVYIKHKLQYIQNYIVEYDLPVTLKMEPTNLNSLITLEDKKYLLHSLTNYNCMWEMRKLKLSPQEYFNFVEPIAHIENNALLKIIDSKTNP